MERASLEAQRRHRLIGHTADVGLEVAAPTPATLLEEAASGLAELAADVGVSPSRANASRPLVVRAADPEALLYAWLNELIGLAEERGEALARAEVSSMDRADHEWAARGRAWFVPFGEGGARPRTAVKAATFHRLRVTPSALGWTAEVYFDV